MKTHYPVVKFSKVSAKSELKANTLYAELARLDETIQLAPHHTETQTVMQLAPLTKDSLPDFDQKYIAILDWWTQDASTQDMTVVGSIGIVQTLTPFVQGDTA